MTELLAHQLQQKYIDTVKPEGRCPYKHPVFIAFSRHTQKRCICNDCKCVKIRCFIMSLLGEVAELIMVPMVLQHERVHSALPRKVIAI